MLLFLLAAAAVQFPNGLIYGRNLAFCALQAIDKVDDDVSAPAIVAHRAVASCTSELAATRRALTTIVSHYMPPNSAPAQEAIDRHMGNITENTEKQLTPWVVEVRKRRAQQ